MGMISKSHRELLAMQTKLAPHEIAHTIQPSDARHLGDTHGDTLGDTVSPSCIPQLARKFKRKYKALADRWPDGINPYLSLGLPISPSVPDSIFRRFIVPSQIATHHHGFQPDGCCRFIGGTVEMEQS
jgi:hypothetical protein